MNDFVLGLDLGVASVGWALAELENKRIVATGVRVFDAPMDMVKFEAGEPGGSNAAKRRTSIQQGRQTARRKARHRDLYVALQDKGLLPFAGKRAERRHEELTALDKTLNNKSWRKRVRAEFPAIVDPGQVLCYYLRAAALNTRLEPTELGRALYHLGQRRGFKSNRREARSGLTVAEVKKDEVERSKMKRAILTLQDELNASRHTLGQQLSLVNPHMGTLRNRKRSDMDPIWTERTMFVQEFDRIWDAQQVHHPSVLTPALKARLQTLMFWQRKVSGGKPGNCELERNPALPRAPRSSLLSQHFRLVQTVNNLKLRESPFAEYQNLTREQRDSLLVELSTVITKTNNKKSPELFGLLFPKVKDRLNLPRKAKLNLDDDDEARYLRGNRTNAIMSRAFGGQQWANMAEQEKRRIVRKWIAESRPEKLLEIATTRWGLAQPEAVQLASLEPEDGYASLSHVAMLKLLRWMEGDGLTYSEAVAKEYGDVFSGGEELEYLPPLENILPQIPNPVVKRALSELRKVLNALIREYDKPKQIRIELARDLKRNAEQRADCREKQKTQEQQRNTAKKWLGEANQRVTGNAIEKTLLYMRCRVCVYCGKSLGNLSDVFSEDAGVQVEHVLPRRAQDDSFSNKLLAHHTCNRRKGDRTPIKAFKDEPDWGEMLDRVTCLKDEALLDKFTMSEDRLTEFSDRHLSDTRHISKLAIKYVEKLYGGRDAAIPWEDRNRRCVYASSGALTANLRNRWGLNTVLKDTYGNGLNRKVRTDHRHHAIDAIVIALTTESMIRQAAFDSQTHDRASGFLQPRYFTHPWPRVGDIEEQVQAFRREIRDVVNQIKVSHRVENKLNGQIHEQTLYSPKIDAQRFVYSRVPVFKLTIEQIEDQNNRIDPEVRKALREHFVKVGGDPKEKIKRFERDVPYIEKDGQKIFIRKVRVAVAASSVQALDRRKGQPSIMLGENHHFVIFERTEEDGETDWYTPGPVSRFEVMRKKDAARRADKKQPYTVVEKTDAPGSIYKMFLMKEDAVEMLDPKSGLRDIYILSSMSDSDYVFLRHNAVVPSPKALGLTLPEMRKRMQDAGDRVRIRLDKLREWDCGKVVLDPLGKVIYLK